MSDNRNIPSRLLHVVASPRGNSKSREIAHAYIAEYTRFAPDTQVTEIDLWSLSLPEMSGDTLGAKYAVLARGEQTAAQEDAWDEVTRITRDFAAHDDYVFSVPMWNFGIPYRLKHYIDVVTQPGLTFSWTPQRGYEGLLHGRCALVSYASSFDYAQPSPLAPLDQQKNYMAGWLALVGITDHTAIDCGPTSAALPKSQEALARALDEARQLARARAGT